ncbi:MAG: restriction endonuclease subunit S [Pseudomonadota bacterium]
MTNPKGIELGATNTTFIDGDRSKRYPKREEFSDSGVLFLNSECISDGTINKQLANHITKEKFLAIKKGRIKKGDILLTTRGNGVGNTAYVNIDDDGLINAQMLILRADNEEIVSKFLFYYLSSNTLRTYIWNFSSGSAQPQIPIRDLKKIPVIIPKPYIQKKIAVILSTYDDLIENNKRRIALLEKMAEEIYREWFIRFRFPGYQKAEFEKGIPKGWKEVSLESIANIQMGQSPKSEFYNTSSEGLPFHQGVGSYGKRFPINEIYCSVTGRIANEGDILFSVRAPVGRLNIADTKMIIGRGLSALSHKKNKNSYLFYFLKIAFVNEDIIGNGSIFNSVGKDELKGFKLLLPKENIIEEFEKIVSKIDNQIKILLQSQENFKKTKEMLLPRLISGKLSVENKAIQFPHSMLEEETIQP